MDPAPEGGGGGTGNWRDSLPPEFRNEPMLAQVPDVATLAKSYINGQRMLGDRVPLPKADWKPEQYNEFYNRLGRPEAPDKYKLPEFQFSEGFPEIDKGRMGESLKHLHSLGLTQSQVEGVLKHHFGSLDAEHKVQIEARKTAHAEGMNKLRDKYGSEDKLKFALDHARGALRKLGGDQQEFEELMEFLDEKNLSNSPAFISLLAKIGEMHVEDRAAGSGGDQFRGSAAQAALEVDRLSADAQFQEALNNKNAPGHAEALARWKQVFYTAYPGKQEN